MSIYDYKDYRDFIEQEIKSKPKKGYGVQGLFAVCTAAMALWLLVAWPMRAPAKAGLPTATEAA